MARVDAIVAKVARVMARLNVCDRPAYKRTVTRTGGDPLTGRGVQVVSQDTLLNPQPVVSPTSAANQLQLSGDGLSQVGAKYILVSASALSRAEVEDPTLSIVFKGTPGNAGAEEVLYIVAFTASLMQGTDIVFELVLSSKKR